METTIFRTEDMYIVCERQYNVYNFKIFFVKCKNKLKQYYFVKIN